MFKYWDYTVLSLSIIGALNWGLIGIFNFDLISWIFCDFIIICKIIYSLIGFAGLFSIASLKRLKESV